MTSPTINQEEKVTMDTTRKRVMKPITDPKGDDLTIADLYRGGVPITTIASRLNKPLGTVSCRLALMRKGGVDLPYRRPERAGIGFKSPGPKPKLKLVEPAPVTNGTGTVDAVSIAASIAAYETDLEQKIASLQAELDRVRTVKLAFAS